MFLSYGSLCIQGVRKGRRKVAESVQKRAETLQKGAETSQKGAETLRKPCGNLGLFAETYPKSAERLQKKCRKGGVSAEKGGFCKKDFVVNPNGRLVRRYPGGGGLTIVHTCPP
jgi:hypothetical protein